MLQNTSKKIRRTTVCVATALAISLPGIAMAGPFGKAKSPKPVVHLGNVVAKAGRKVAKAAKKGPAPLPGAEIVELVRDLDLEQQLLDTVALMQEIEADYQYFSGGLTGCKAECKAFRKQLKDAFSDFLWLVEDVPALQNSAGLIEKIERVSNLVDYVPPRALYLMWQALDGRLDEIRTAVDGIGRILDTLPPLADVSDIAAAMNDTAAKAEKEVCEWVRADPAYIELVQAELERLAWVLGTVAGFIPDIEVEGAAGAEAGMAVANATAEAALAMKITDPLKIALQVVQTIPETINWAIKLNILRAKVYCDARGYNKAG